MKMMLRAHATMRDFELENAIQLWCSKAEKLGKWNDSKCRND